MNKIQDVVSKKYLSDCCDAPVYMPTSEWARCLECKEMCDVHSEECEYCGGSGVVSVMEPVDSGEPHMAPIGERVCECQLNNNDEYEPE